MNVDALVTSRFTVILKDLIPPSFQPFGTKHRRFGKVICFDVGGDERLGPYYAGLNVHGRSVFIR